MEQLLVSGYTKLVYYIERYTGEVTITAFKEKGGTFTVNGNCKKAPVKRKF